jgi:hypothetical protein
MTARWRVCSGSENEAAKMNEENLVWDVEVGRKPRKAAQYHGRDICMHVSESVGVYPHNSGSEKEYARMLVARAQAHEKGAEAERGDIRAADATHCKVYGPRAQHVVERKHFALDAIQPHLNDENQREQHASVKGGAMRRGSECLVGKGVEQSDDGGNRHANTPATVYKP